MKTQQTPFPSGIFFDMDGTLLQTGQRSEQTWLDVFTHFAPQHHVAPELLSQTMREAYARYQQSIAGDEAKLLRDRLHPFEVRKELVEQVLRSAGKRNTDLAEDMVRLYELFRERHRLTIPFARETLEQLQKQHIRLALLTNGNATYQRKKLEQHHLASFFECILIEEEFGVGKSDPRIYQAALNQLHLPAQETWMVGDNLFFDVATPQQLGIFTFWFDPLEKGLPPHPLAQPDRIIRTLPELLQELRNASTPSSLL
jgi:putative hydrolase of the HAD superfamily